MGSGQNSRYGRNDNNGRGDRNQQYRGRGKRDPMIGKVVQITGAGIWKGSFATVLGVGGSSGEQYFLELHSKLKKVYINKKRCQEVSERSTSNNNNQGDFNSDMGNYGSGNRDDPSFYAMRTPAHTMQTPNVQATPMHYSTPSHFDY